MVSACSGGGDGVEQGPNLQHPFLLGLARGEVYCVQVKRSMRSFEVESPDAAWDDAIEMIFPDLVESLQEGLRYKDAHSRRRGGAVQVEHSVASRPLPCRHAAGSGVQLMQKCK